MDLAVELEGGDPAADARAVAAELGRFSPRLERLPRWLVVNKIDLYPAAEREAAVERLRARLDWPGPVLAISAETGEGTADLVRAVGEALGEMGEREAAAAGKAAE